MYAPFWQGTQTIGALGRQNLFTSSFPTLSYLLLERNYGMSTEAAKGIARNTSLVLIALIVIGFTLYVFLNRNARTPPERRALIFRTLRAFYEILFFYLALTNLWFQPWYLIWLVALAPILADHVTANRTLLFCIGGILNYFVWFFLWGWNRADGMDITVTAILAVYFLPLFYTLYAALKAFYDRIWSRQAQAAQVAVPADVPHEVVVQEAGPSNLSTRPARSRP